MARFTSQNQVSNVIVQKNFVNSQAVLVNHTLYLSGVLGADKIGKLVEGGAVAEARQALTNMGHILKEAGSI